MDAGVAAGGCGWGRALSSAGTRSLETLGRWLSIPLGDKDLLALGIGLCHPVVVGRVSDLAQVARSVQGSHARGCHKADCGAAGPASCRRLLGQGVDEAVSSPVDSGEPAPIGADPFANGVHRLKCRLPDQHIVLSQRDDISIQDLCDGAPNTGEGASWASRNGRALPGCGQQGQAISPDLGGKRR